MSAYSIPEDAIILPDRWRLLFEQLVHPNALVDPDFQELIRVTASLATPLWRRIEWGNWVLGSDINVSAFHIACRAVLRITEAEAENLSTANINAGHLTHSDGSLHLSEKVCGLSRAVVIWRTGAPIWFLAEGTGVLTSAPYWFGTHRWLSTDKQYEVHATAMGVNYADWAAEELTALQIEQLVDQLNVYLFKALPTKSPDEAVKRVADALLAAGSAVAQLALDQIQGR
ncbi:hypothetical protein ACFWIB_39235 [Streptomyces sp. NPDC127051]|uniref:hypothetical protein n=1 Tax=Streptomyces sp. NPDC127051 TaxID=3347119 RepID=UPI0036548786